MTEQLITTQELAKQLKTPISWVYGQTRKKDEDAIPVIRVGKYCRFRLGDVLEWLERMNKKG